MTLAAGISAHVPGDAHGRSRTIQRLREGDRGGTVGERDRPIASRARRSMNEPDRTRSESTSERERDWLRLCELFNDAREMPEADRSAFLDRELQGEPALRAEIDSLLASASTVGAFLAPREGGGAPAPFSSRYAPGST